MPELLMSVPRLLALIDRTFGVRRQAAAAGEAEALDVAVDAAVFLGAVSAFRPGLGPVVRARVVAFADARPAANEDVVLGRRGRFLGRRTHRGGRASALVPVLTSHGA